MMNGTVTLGSEDATNLEMLKAVGPANIYLFKTAEPDELSSETAVRADNALAFIAKLGYTIEPGSLEDIMEYLECLDRARDQFQDRETWTRMEIENIRHAAPFSSDQTIRNYADQIWHLPEEGCAVPKPATQLKRRKSFTLL